MAAGVFRAEFRPSTRPDGSFAFRHPVNLNRITPKQIHGAGKLFSSKGRQSILMENRFQVFVCVSCCSIFISNGYNLTIGSDAQPNGQSVV